MRYPRHLSIYVLIIFLFVSTVHGFFGNGFFSHERRKKRIRNFDIAGDILKGNQENASLSNNSSFSNVVSVLNASLSALSSNSSAESSEKTSNSTPEFPTNQSIFVKETTLQNETKSSIKRENVTLETKNETFAETMMVSFNVTNTSLLQTISNSSEQINTTLITQSLNKSDITNNNFTANITIPLKPQMHIDGNATMHSSIPIGPSNVTMLTSPPTAPIILSPVPTFQPFSIQQSHLIGKERPHHIFPTKNESIDSTFNFTNSSLPPNGILPVYTTSPSMIPSTALKLISPPISSTESSQPSFMNSTVSSNNPDNPENITTSLLKSLETTYEGINSTKGVMFDVMTWDEIQVTSLDLHISTTSDVFYEIYTKAGTHVEHEKSVYLWSIVSSGKIQGRGEFVKTPIPQESFLAVTIPRNSVQSFYVTLTTSDLRYSSGIIKGNDYINADLLIQGGVVVSEYPFGFSTMEPCIWNGAIHYTTAIRSDVNLINDPTNIPSVMPSLNQEELRRKRSVYLFGLFLMYPSNITFLPNVKENFDYSLHSLLRKPYHDSLSKESADFLEANNVAIISVNSVPVDVEDNDVRCPTNTQPNERCKATNVYIETSYLFTTPSEAVQETLRNILPSIVQEIEYKTRIIQPIIQSNVILMSLFHVHQNATFMGYDIALFEDIISKSLKETFSAGLLPFEVLDVEVFGDSISLVSDTLDIRSKSMEDTLYEFTLATSIRTSHFILHQSLSIVDVLIHSLEADSQNIIEGLQVSNDFNSISSMKAYASFKEKGSDVIKEEIGISLQDRKLFSIIAGSTLGGFILAIGGFLLISGSKPKTKWQEVNRNERNEDDDDFKSVGETSVESSKDADSRISGKNNDERDERFKITSEELLLQPIIESNHEAENESISDLEAFLLEPHVNIDDLTDKRTQTNSSFDDVSEDNQSSILESLKDESENTPGTPKINNKKKSFIENNVEDDAVSLSNSYISTGSFDNVVYEYDEDLPSIT